MQHGPDIPHHRGDASVATTAHHMAEALTFLMRVASEAGLPTVALKLEDARATVIRQAISQPSMHIARHDEN
jgi:hypothetical protein